MSRLFVLSLPLPENWFCEDSETAEAAAIFIHGSSADICGKKADETVRNAYDS